MNSPLLVIAIALAVIIFLVIILLLIWPYISGGKSDQALKKLVSNQRDFSRSNRTREENFSTPLKKSKQRNAQLPH
ncbi:MAG: hypothetical protein R3A13_06790 [Bdellovibrionota bacterium]